MSITETPAADSAKKPARRPAKKRVKRSRQPTAVRSAPPEMVGLTTSTCADACNAERCIISGVGICAHPYKGGLQAGMQNPDAARRLNQAKRVIGKRKLDIAAGE